MKIITLIAVFLSSQGQVIEQDIYPTMTECNTRASHLMLAHDLGGIRLIKLECQVSVEV